MINRALMFIGAIMSVIGAIHVYQVATSPQNVIGGFSLADALVMLAGLTLFGIGFIRAGKR